MDVATAFRDSLQLQSLPTPSRMTASHEQTLLRPVFDENDLNRLVLFGKNDAEHLHSNCLIVLGRILTGSTAGSQFVLDAVAQRSLMRQDELPSDDTHNANVEIRRNRLLTIKSAYGLTTKQLADVCNVSRAAIYKWLSLDKEHHLSVANWQRVTTLSSLAALWNSKSTAPPGQFLDEQRSDGSSLLSRLCAPSLDTSHIRIAHEEILRLMTARPLRRDEKLRRLGITPQLLVNQIRRDE